MSKLRFVIAAAAVAGLLLVAPSGASAAESCLFQSTKVTARNQEEVNRSLLCLTNLYRVQSGVGPIPLDTRLYAAAKAHSADMHARGFFAHDNPDGASPPERAMAFGYPGGAGENIAMNVEGTALKLIEQWKASPDHNRNLLQPSFRAIGVGVVRGCCPSGPEGAVGTQMFGLVPSDTNDTGFDFYASSDGCAKAKLARLSILEKPKKKRSAKLQRKLKRLNREIGKRCKPPT
jgi:uncharacterized protein YkwD